MSSAGLLLLLIGVALGAAAVALSGALVRYVRRRQQATAQEARLAEQAEMLQEASEARRAVVEASIERMAGWIDAMPLDRLLHLEEGLHELEFVEIQQVRRWWESVATHPEWFRPIGVEDYDSKLRVFYAIYQEADVFFAKKAEEA